MAAKSKNTSRKKANTKSSQSKPTREQTEAQRIARTRMSSTVIFIIGIFVIFLTYIQGQALWSGMHNILWGLFGISTVLLAPIIIYVAVMMALDRSKSAVIVKIMQGAVLMLLISPLFEIIYSFINSEPPYTGADGSTDFNSVITALYNKGVEMKGGGALSIIIGGTLSSLCGAVCALIIIILLILLLIMLLTNITSVDIWNFIVSTVRKIKNAVNDNRNEYAEEMAKKQAVKPAVEEKIENPKKTSHIDIAKFLPDDEPADEPIEDKMPAHPVVSGIGLTQEEAPEKPKKVKVKKEKRPITPGDAVMIDKEKETPDDTTAEANEIVSDTVNPIYVDEDGQTTLIENETATKSLYSLPPTDLLNMPRHTASVDETRAEIAQNSETLVDTLKSFGVSTRIVEIHRGPSVTRYELQPAAGVKVSKITGLVDDIALNLAANGVRIEAPIPGKAAVGIELANKIRDTVYIKELIDSDEFRSMKSKIAFPVGKNIEGKIITVDIAKMPHLLIAGTTGSGKSVLTNSIIMSILFNASPDEVKLILIDPKQVEFPVYNGIPHLLIPVVTEAKKAAGALGWAVTEMMKRYNMFANSGVKDLKEYNEFVKDKEKLCPLPQIVIIVDELADLMMAAPKEVEDYICRLAQLARAAGMHLVIATQSPRVNVITGLIKANIDSRIALRVSSQIDSGVILNEIGAEKLLGHGDLLIRCAGFDKPMRIQGGYVATDEIRRVVDYLKAQQSSQYDEEIASEIEKHIPVAKGERGAASGSDSSGDSNSEESMIDRAIEVIVENQTASTSFLQRKLKLGYARAARIMDELEEMGIIGPGEGAKQREIRMTHSQWLERKASLGGAAMPVLDKPDEEDI